MALRKANIHLPFTPWAGGVSAVAGYEGILARVEGGIRDTGEFAEPERLRLDWQATVTREAWLDQVPTMGGHNLIGESRLAELLDRLGTVIDEHGGSFTMSYATIAIAATRSTESARTP